MIVRTLDIGGDKSLPYIQQAAEANPFLGVRAIRLSLAQPDLFLAQLRAILRAGADHDLRIMYPMIANLDEILQARELARAGAPGVGEGGICRTAGPYKPGSWSRSLLPRCSATRWRRTSTFLASGRMT